MSDPIVYPADTKLHYIPPSPRPQFIEVHDKRGNAHLLNVANILEVSDRGGEARIQTVVPTPAGSALYGVLCEETYAEVQELLGWFLPGKIIRTETEEAETDGN